MWSREQVRSWARRHVRPLTLMWVVVIISCFALPEQGGGGEFFPLSSYPMYSRNKEKTYYVYLTDGKGNPIPSEEVLDVRTLEMKKDYNARLTTLVNELGMSDYLMTAEQKRPAALDSLRFLVEHRSPEQVRKLNLEAIQLVDVRLEMRDFKLDRREEIVGRLELE